MKNITLLLLSGIIFCSSCKKDNYDPPESTLTGKILFNKLPVSLRSNGVQLSLWQYGYNLRNRIIVHVDQDGTFNARVFDGDYKMTLLSGSGPWVDNTDSIDIKVRGNATVEVNVRPYFVISDANFQRNGNTVTGTVRVQQIDNSKPIEFVRMYFGQTTITDAQNNAGGSVTKNAADLTDLTQPITLTGTIPASLQTKDYVFVRVGVKTLGVSELIYNMPVEISK